MLSSIKNEKTTTNSNVIAVSQDKREYILVELQGQLEYTSIQDMEINESIVGTIDTDANPPQLQIGNQILHGKIVTLAKPIVVLRSRPAVVAKDNDGDDYQRVFYDQIIRQKFLFNTRPATIL